RFLVAVNLHPTQAMKDIRIEIPREVVPRTATWIDRFGSTTKAATMENQQVLIPEIPPLTPLLLEFSGTKIQ
ncbi:MAG: hypothetical protein ACXWBM_06400, partial [Chthoniobacterales bacterium]